VGSVLFEPNDLLMFRGPMEFTPTVRGPQAIARTLPLPLPSTIVGCLATLLLDRGVSAMPKASASWEDGLIQVLGLDGEACFRGPYLLVDNEVYVPFEEGLIRLADLSEVLGRLRFEEVVGGAVPLHEALEQRMIHLKKVESVGIGLEKATKTVKHGLLYSAEFVDYRSTFNGRKVCIAMDVYGETALNTLPSTEGYVIRLGGEGRTVQVRIEGARHLEEEVEKIAAEGRSLIYVVSPALMRTPLAGLAPVVSTRKLKFSISNVPVDLLVGRIDVLGVGFDIRRGIRKPMYASLTHGSLLLTEVKRADLIKLYRRGLSDVGCKLGYGTFIPAYVK
jgi:CRISPR/Cas system CMR-associated protein Cmr3 (group 5 of RAMP superfamily)